MMTQKHFSQLAKIFKDARESATDGQDIENVFINIERAITQFVMDYNHRESFDLAKFYQESGHIDLHCNRVYKIVSLKDWTISPQKKR